MAQASATVPANNDKPSSAKTNNVATAAGQPAAGQTNTNQPANPAGAIQQASHTNKTDAASTAATAFLSDTDSSEPAAQPSGTASPAMTVETALEKASVNELVQALNERIESGAKDAPEEQRVRAQLLQRLLQVANRDHAAALEPIKELSPNEQKFVKHQLEALVKLVDEQGTPSRTRRYSEILPTLREAVSELGAATGALSVSEPIFCTEVESYGSVTRFEKFSFKPGQQVILYCEIDNFVAEQSSKGYETHLQGSYEIFDGSGLKVAEQTLPEDKQICDHYRRDYFIAYRLYLANQLQPGAHRLRLTMKDHKGKLYGQSEVAFEIVKP